MLAVIRGVKVLGGITISELMQKDSRIVEVANAIVVGAEETKTEWTASDDCVVTLQIPRQKVEQLIREDSKRPLTDKERKLAMNWALEGQASISRATYYPDYGDKTPLKALGLGMAFPGLGQLYVGGKDTDNGYYTMVAVLALAGVGGSFLRPHDVGEARADGTYRQERTPEYGYPLLGLAALLHVNAAVDAMKSAGDRGGYFVIEPLVGGAGATWKKKF